MKCCFRLISLLLALTLLAVAASGAARTHATSPAGAWTTTGSMTTGRWGHTATLLLTGKVLVAGGDTTDYTSSVLASAELYDPTTGTWAATGSMGTGRAFHTATLLANGKVLVAGGYGDSSALDSAELYDPTTGTWAATGSLKVARTRYTATLLASGKILIAGGQATDNSSLASAELYDPIAGLWTATGSLSIARGYHTATLLASGKVLVAGGQGTAFALTSAELYDPTAGLWTATGSLNTGRQEHTATLLPAGTVLVAGGQGIGYPVSAELYDPITSAWATTGSMSTARFAHTATLLAAGTVLAAGGLGPTGDLASAELYDPTAGLWAATGSMTTPRDHHTATLLPTGTVLIAGGFRYPNGLASAELYGVAIVVDTTVASVSCTPATVLANQPTSCTATVKDTGPGTPIPPTGTVTFISSDGAGTFAGSPCTLTSSGLDSASCAVTYTPTAPSRQAITATYGGDAAHSGSSGTTSLVVGAFAAGGGAFVIGDLKSAAGTNVTFWGAAWGKNNPTSSGSKAPSFKGFADSPATPSCGSPWSSGPGNSVQPPAGPLPPYLAVLVTSAYDKAGPTLTGNSVHIVIVKTDPGYAADPGHAGTGTVVGQYC